VTTPQLATSTEFFHYTYRIYYTGETARGNHDKRFITLN